MKKIFTIAFTLLFTTCIVKADGNAFTPLDFNDTQYGTSTKTTPATVKTTQKLTSLDGEGIGNSNIQNAILQLDNAQVDIRNDLLNCKTKYADVDAQYKLVKAERAALKKQVKSVEKRIKDIEKAKEKIRKNML